MTVGMVIFKIRPLILNLIVLIFDFTCDAVSLYSDVINTVCSKNLLFQTVLFQWRAFDSRRRWTAMNGCSRLTVEFFCNLWLQKTPTRISKLSVVLNFFCKSWEEKKKWAWIKLLLPILLTSAGSSLCAFSSPLYLLWT